MSCWVWHYVSASLQVCIFRTLPLSSSFLLILLSLSVSFLLCVCLFLYIFVRSLTNSLPAYLQSTYLPTCSHTYVLSHLPTYLPAYQLPTYLPTSHLHTCLHACPLYNCIPVTYTTAFLPPTHLPTYLPAYIPPYLPTYMPYYLPTYCITT